MGSYLVDVPYMAERLAGSFASISQAKPRDLVAEQQVLQAFARQCQRISTEAAQTVGQEQVLLAEVQKAAARQPSGKAPGPDGIPAELWRKCKDVLYPLLTALYSAIGRTGDTPPGFLGGVVSPIPKGGDAADTTNYRPITLLNTDYRILARVLAQRLAPVLDGVVGPEQTAFLPGRLIGDNVTFLQLLPDALKAQMMGTPDQQRSAVVALLDFRKTYDTIQRPFLLQAMQVAGVGNGFIKWTNTLLSATSAATCVNGFVSSAMNYSAGVRQGCPLAPLLYLFISWALLSWLKECPAVGITIAGQQHHGVQYADDTQTLLKNLEQPTVHQFVTAMDVFGRASGQHLNLTKTKLMPVGDIQAWHPLPRQVSGIKVVESATALGIPISNGGDGGDSVQWQQLLDTVTYCYGKIAKLPCRHIH